MPSLTPDFKIDDVTIPRFFYGTAWKEDRTHGLTALALKSGFKAIDTANQRKHYFEEAVGNGIKDHLDAGNDREDLFLQTKFTFARGQDHRKPYNENDSYTKQVADSFASSLTHLHTNTIDSYVLHGPYGADGIVEEDLESWAAMEKLVHDKKVKFLGISNVSASQLLELCSQVKIRPRFVQNRCYARTGWDQAVREICASKDIMYQGFSLLTANQREIVSDPVIKIAQKYQKTIPQTTFRFCQQVGMICLTGTSDAEHMQEDLDIYDFELNAAEVELMENIGL